MFENQVVVITGSANGIGKEIALTYGENQARLVLIDRDEEGLQSVATKLKSMGIDFLTFGIDIKDVKSIESVIKTVDEKWGKIDILINNAGVSKFYSPYEITEDEWDDIVNNNLKGAFFMARECAKVMKRNGVGRIVNIASTRAFISEPGGEAYGASKGGIISLTHALAISLGEDGILVNSISPGWIHTGPNEELRTIDHLQHPAQRVGKPADIAQACLFLTSPENQFITGENITIDGGMTKKMIYEE